MTPRGTVTTNILPILFAALLCLPYAAFAQAPDGTAGIVHDPVQASYERYQAAIAANKGAAEVKAALEAYQATYRDYLGKISGDAPSLLGTPGTTDGLAIPGVTTRRTETATPQSRLVEPRSIPAPLYAKKSKINDMLQRLEASLESKLSPIVESRIRLELAFLYAEFKKDMVKAREMTQKVLDYAKQGLLDDQLAAAANETATRLDAKLGLNDKMQSALAAKQLATEAAKQREAISFWTNPLSKVKAAWNSVKLDLKYRVKVAQLREFRDLFEKTGKVYLNTPGLSYLFDLQRLDLGPSDIYDAIAVAEESEDAEAHYIFSNNEAWYARWYMLSNAKSTIDCTYFIVEKDVYGMSLLGLLLEKAKQGLRIRFMVDARGTKQLAKTFMGQDYLQELVKYPNVQVKVFNPVHQALPRIWADIRTLLCSDHDKIIVVDSEWMITGGRNVSLNYFADPGDDPTVYRDSDVVARSRVLCQALDIAFTEEFAGLYNQAITKDLFGDWRSCEEELLQASRSMNRYIRGDGLYDGKEPWTVRYNEELAKYKHMTGFANYYPFPNQRAHRIKILDKHSFNDERNDITENIVRLIEASTREILIQNPYVILTPVIHEALLRADRRGVKTLINTNSPVSTDSILTQAFFIDDWKKFLVEMPNLQIWAFNGNNKLHSKIFCFDRTVSIVGTYNMDYMSEQINSEVVACIDSPEFAEEMLAAVKVDLTKAVQYQAKRNADGSIEEVYGPRDFSPKKTLLILDILKNLKMLKPLI